MLNSPDRLIIPPAILIVPCELNGANGVSATSTVPASITPPLIVRLAALVRPTRTLTVTLVTPGSSIIRIEPLSSVTLPAQTLNPDPKLPVITSAELVIVKAPSPVIFSSLLLRSVSGLFVPTLTNASVLAPLPWPEIVRLLMVRLVDGVRASMVTVLVFALVM